MSAALLLILMLVSSQPPVTLINLRDQPVSVVATLRGTNDGDALAVTFGNLSQVAIRYARFLLIAPDCGSMHGGRAYVIEYGDRAAYEDVVAESREKPLKPKAHATVLVPSAVWLYAVKVQRLEHCDGDGRPDLVLGNVAMCDGTGWRRVATSSDPSTWQSEAWVPRPGAQCK